MYSVEKGLIEFDKQITWACYKRYNDPLVRDFFKSLVLKEIYRNSRRFQGEKGNFFEWVQVVIKNTNISGTPFNYDKEPIEIKPVPQKPKSEIIQTVKQDPEQVSQPEPQHEPLPSTYINPRMESIISLQNKYLKGIDPNS
jgi:hypothetical protein